MSRLRNSFSNILVFFKTIHESFQKETFLKWISTPLKFSCHVWTFFDEDLTSSVLISFIFIFQDLVPVRQNGSVRSLKLFLLQTRSGQELPLRTNSWHDSDKNLKTTDILLKSVVRTSLENFNSTRTKLKYGSRTKERRWRSPPGSGTH